VRGRLGRRRPVYISVRGARIGVSGFPAAVVVAIFSGIRISICVCIPVRFRVSAIRVSVAVAGVCTIGITVSVIVLIGISISLGFVLVDIARRLVRVGVLILVSFFGTRLIFSGDVIGGLTFLRCAADIDGDSLSRLDNFTGPRQLKENRIALDLIAWSGRTNAKVQAGFFQLVLSNETILADNLRHCYFGTPQRQIHSAGKSK
jgi:hypothetical protein